MPEQLGQRLNAVANGDSNNLKALEDEIMIHLEAKMLQKLFEAAKNGHTTINLGKVTIPPPDFVNEGIKFFRNKSDDLIAVW